MSLTYWSMKMQMKLQSSTVTISSSYIFPAIQKGSYGILKDGVLYAGDSYAVINGTPIEPPHAYSIEEMKDSVRKISELSPEYLACGHGVPFLFADHKM